MAHHPSRSLVTGASSGIGAAFVDVTRAFLPDMIAARRGARDVDDGPAAARAAHGRADDASACVTNPA
ncbi:MAG: hypothetical protein KF727_05410 [Microbacteriaceae bacterium]|nr:hypothetical protein [Microbacteriaceae bacterium]